MAEQYTIWLVPSSEVKSVLDKTINNLAQKYKTPVFEPHITLLGDIKTSKEDVLEKANLLARRLKPFNVDLGEISYSTTYFQNVFVRAVSNAQLMQAYVEAKNIFKQDVGVYMPHISLIYGYHNMEERNNIASEVDLPKGLSFKVDKLVVIPATDNPDEWEHIAEIKIG